MTVGCYPLAYWSVLMGGIPGCARLLGSLLSTRTTVKKVSCLISRLSAHISTWLTNGFGMMAYWPICLCQETVFPLCGLPPTTMPTSFVRFLLTCFVRGLPRQGSVFWESW